MIDEIKGVARQQLTTEGSNLSLRAITRELGMVSSAIYRYFASRDDLLTALIIDGYTALADVVEAADRAIPRTDLAGRFVAVAHAIRHWARDHRAEYALLYGSPVPGYVAPQDTVVPVVRISMVMIEILRDGVASGGLVVTPNEPVSAPLRRDFTQLLIDIDRTEIPPAILARGLTAWAGLFGAVSFELFGHSVGITSDYDALFDSQVTLLNRLVGTTD